MVRSAWQGAVSVTRQVSCRHISGLSVGASPLPGPDGFRTRQPQQLCDLEDLATNQALGVSGRPVCHHFHFTLHFTLRNLELSSVLPILPGVSRILLYAALSTCRVSNTAPRASTPTRSARSCSPTPPPRRSAPGAAQWPAPSGCARPFAPTRSAARSAPHGSGASVGTGLLAC